MISRTYVKIDISDLYQIFRESEGTCEYALLGVLSNLGVEIPAGLVELPPILRQQSE